MKRYTPILVLFALIAPAFALASYVNEKVGIGGTEHTDTQVRAVEREMRQRDDGDITQIQINPARIIARGVDRKLGICLNFTMDRNDKSLRAGLQQLGVSAIRFQEGEFGDNWHFDADVPARPLLGVADPKIWYHRSKTDDQRWKSTLTPAGFLDLASTQQFDAYSIVGIDALVYNGNSPHMSRADVIASAAGFVQFANKTTHRLNRSEPLIQYWEIGNENDLPGMLGKLKLGRTWNATQYAQIAAELAVHMKRGDPQVRIGVNGMTPKSNWWRDVLSAEVQVNGQTRRLSDLIDFLVTHQYSWVASYQQWRDAGHDWQYSQNVAAAVKAARDFSPGKPVAVTEWSAYSPGKTGNKDQSNNAWHAIHNLQMLGEILKHESVTHACFWVTRWSPGAGKLHNALTADGKLTPVGESLRFWSEFSKPELVEGAHSGKICVYATSDRHTGSMAIFLLNRSDKSKTVALNIVKNGRMNIARIDHLCAAQDDPMAMKVERRMSPNPDGSHSGSPLVELPPISATVVSLIGSRPESSRSMP